MKRKYHSTKYRPNGSLRTNPGNYGAPCCDATARDFKIEAALMRKAYGHQDKNGPDKRMLRLERTIGPRRTKQAQEAIAACSSRTELKKAARRIYDAYQDAECAYQDEQLLRYAR